MKVYLASGIAKAPSLSLFDVAEVDADPGQDAIAFWDDGDGALEWIISIPDAFVSESSVTQHQAALAIAFSQLTGTPQIPGGLQEFADDAAADTGGIAVNGLYRTGSVVKIRVS